MKKSILLLLAITALLVLASCDVNELKEKHEKSLCPQKYMRLGTTCCLDKNNNTICDSDEQKNPAYGGCGMYPTSPTCEAPNIKVGTRCCADENNNKICDDEDLSTTSFTCEKPKPSARVYPRRLEGNPSSRQAVGTPKHPHRLHTEGVLSASGKGPGTSPQRGLNDPGLWLSKR